VPLVIACGKVFLLGGNLWAMIYGLALYGAIQAFSYGETAPINKLWSKVFGHGTIDSELATRATCGLLWAIPACIFAILTGNWLIFGIYVIFLTVANAIIWYLVKDVEVNERLVGACVALAILV